jgi:hypothetical protein
LIVVPGAFVLLPADPSELVFLFAAPVEESPGCIVSAADAVPAAMLKATAAIRIILMVFPPWL